MVLTSLVTLVASSAAAGSSINTATYGTTVTIPAPPSSNFSGASGGGDGWAVALTSTQLFNVFHHQAFLGVNCHNQSDASACWPAYKTITDAGNGFATSSQPGLWMDQANGHLFVFATEISNGNAGVVCIDTTKPASDLDPFCGFTVLATTAGTGASGGISNISDPVLDGSDWYAFNFVTGTPTGSEDKLMCFDTATLAPCASQPYAVNYGGGTVSVGYFPSPSIALIANQVIVPFESSNGAKLACFNAVTQGSCGGSWPVALSFGYPSSNGASFPLMTSAGVITGLCLPTGTDQCYSLSGASVATPAGLTTSVTDTSGWNGPSLVLGPRVYVPNGNINTVQCFDYSTGASCTNFPKALTNLDLLYTVNPDPDRPTCIWVNSDNGADQIQDFDAYTGGQCGQGPLRVLTSQVVVDEQMCLPTSWDSLQITAPKRSAYTSGTVEFQNVDGDTIPGVPTQTLDNTGSINLKPLTKLAGGVLPQFVITLVNPPVNLTEVDVKLTWTAQYSQACLKTGVTAATTTTTTTSTTTTTVPTSTTIPGVTTPHTGEPWAGAAPFELGLLAVGLGLIGFGENRRRRSRRRSAKTTS
jgi:hypothetical protein